jgi:hypothetical protein
MNINELRELALGLLDALEETSGAIHIDPDRQCEVADFCESSVCFTCLVRDLSKQLLLSSSPRVKSLGRELMLLPRGACGGE